MVAATLVAAGVLAVAGQPAAHAGGTPVAECSSGREFDVSDAGDEPDVGPPVHLTAGYYAQTGSFWPPRTAVLCDTGSGRRQPVARIAAGNGVGCPSGTRELLVPDEIPNSYDTPVVARSGAYLPAGWYTLATADPEPTGGAGQPSGGQPGGAGQPSGGQPGGAGQPSGGSGADAEVRPTVGPDAAAVTVVGAGTGARAGITGITGIRVVPLTRTASTAGSAGAAASRPTAVDWTAVCRSRTAPPAQVF